MDQVLQNIVSFLWIIYLNSCCAHFGYPASTIYYIWCQFHNSLLVLNQKETSTNKPSLDSLLVQCACSIPWSELNLREATATAKCKRWFSVFLMLLTMQKPSKTTVGDSSVCVCDCPLGGWGKVICLCLPTAEVHQSPSSMDMVSSPCRNQAHPSALWAGNAVNFIFPWIQPCLTKTAHYLFPFPGLSFPASKWLLQLI